LGFLVGKAHTYLQVNSTLDQIRHGLESEDASLMDLIESTVEWILSSGEQAAVVANYLHEVGEQADVEDLNNLLTTIETTRDDLEQVVDDYSVNILSTLIVYHYLKPTNWF
jgi:hypothetical protein